MEYTSHYMRASITAALLFAGDLDIPLGPLGVEKTDWSDKTNDGNPGRIDERRTTAPDQMDCQRPKQKPSTYG